ncbi:hypothetical protein S40288_09733 [Stachybotrys chartarum IBT 40288]|nr:hypothetical protein S40288_09733 [Stachybotrys chartarum IBT 40288]
MGGTRHYVVRKREHPGSSSKEIAEEPNWGSGHNHRVGYKNRDNRLPGYAHGTDSSAPEEHKKEGRKKYMDLRERQADGALLNFRDIVGMKEDVHLTRPHDLSVGWRYMLECTEDWVKHKQEWPANQKRAAEEAKKKGIEDKGRTEETVKGGEHGEPGGKDNGGQHGHLELKESDLSQEQRAMLRAIEHEKEVIVNYKVNPGNLQSPMKDHRETIYIDEADQFTPDNWVPRSSNLIRITGKHPLNAEAHLTKFFDAGLITPNELHYVRNHGAVPRLLWELHKVEVDVGSDRGAQNFSMDELKHDFWSINVPVFLACDGNRRKELNLIRKSQGFNWGPGAGGCAYWKGAPLRDVLLRAGYKHSEEHDRTIRRWVNFEGSDNLAEGKYATCIPLDYAMDKSNDVLLAYEMNDMPLPPDHGYPVRVIIPGYVGGRCVKWLSRVWISDKENDSYYHVWDNRVLPSFVTDTESPFAELLFLHPDTACNEQNLNSVIVRPQQGERLYFSDVSEKRHDSRGAGPGEYRIEGFAYDGGGHEVQRVEVSLDNGVNWLYCIRKYPETPIRHGKKFWTWCHWHVDVSLAKLVQAEGVIVRCFNVFKNSQPRDPAWNLMGMMNNCWYQVKAEITAPPDNDDSDSGLGFDYGSNSDSSSRRGVYLLFRHPVEPAIGGNGWMKPSIENQMEAAKREANTPQKQFTREEIEQHDTEKDCWIVVDGMVYDATSVMSWHPGGKMPIMAHAGRVHQETTSEFASIHNDFAYEKLKECLLGTVTEKAANFIKENAQHQAAEQAAASKDHSSATLQKHRWFPVKLLARESLSNDTRLYRFQLPDRRAVLGLSTCKHIQLGFHMLDSMVVRSYTPTNPILPPPKETSEVLPATKWESNNEDSKLGKISAHDDNPQDGDGTFELVVKTYFPTDEQPGGAMSNILDCMPIGEDLEVRGPTGDIEYQGNGKFLIDGKEYTFHRISLVLGGSGVTPGYALMARIGMSQESDVELRVIDGNKTEGDILMRTEMEKLQEQSGGKIRVTHVLSHPLDDWKGLKGHVNEDLIRTHIFPPGKDSAVFVCGPPTMIQMAVMPALKNWGYEEDNDVFGF